MGCQVSLGQWPTVHSMAWLGSAFLSMGWVSESPGDPRTHRLKSIHGEGIGTAGWSVGKSQKPHETVSVTLQV